MEHDSSQVGAVINTKTPSEHVNSHLKQNRNAHNATRHDETRRDLQSSISQVINHSIAFFPLSKTRFGHINDDVGHIL